MRKVRVRKFLAFCPICGKKKDQLNGWWYKPEYLRKLGVQVELTPVWQGRVFACNRCVFPLEENNTPIMKLAAQIRAEQALAKKPKLTRYGYLMADLRGVLMNYAAHEDKWLRIADIVTNFRHSGFPKMNGKLMSLVLNEAGFLRRRRGTNNFSYVFIEHDKIASAGRLSDGNQFQC